MQTSLLSHIYIFFADFPSSRGSSCFVGASPLNSARSKWVCQRLPRTLENPWKQIPGWPLTGTTISSWRPNNKKITELPSYGLGIGIVLESDRKCQQLSLHKPTINLQVKPRKHESSRRFPWKKYWFPRKTTFDRFWNRRSLWGKTYSN